MTRDEYVVVDNTVPVPLFFWFADVEPRESLALVDMYIDSDPT